MIETCYVLEWPVEDRRIHALIWLPLFYFLLFSQYINDDSRRHLFTTLASLFKSMTQQNTKFLAMLKF